MLDAFVCFRRLVENILDDACLIEIAIPIVFAVASPNNIPISVPIVIAGIKGTNDNHPFNCAHVAGVRYHRVFRLRQPRVVRPGSDKLTGYNQSTRRNEERPKIWSLMTGLSLR